MRLTISFLLVASILLLSGIQAQKYDGIVVENAERTIDLTTQLARYTTKFTVANQGNNLPSTSSSWWKKLKRKNWLISPPHRRIVLIWD